MSYIFIGSVLNLIKDNNERFVFLKAHMHNRSMFIAISLRFIEYIQKQDLISFRFGILLSILISMHWISF